MPQNLRRTKAVSWLAGALALASLASLLMTPGSALAHSGYESSTPADGEVLAESPPEVAVTFGQEMARSGGLPTMIVVNDAGDTLSEEAVLSDEDRTVMTAALPAQMANGRYTVIWHTISDEDGEEAKGAFHFYVGEGPDSQPSDIETTAPGATTAPKATVAPTPEDDSDDGGIPVLALVAGVIGGAVAGVGGGLALGRRRSG